MEGVVVGDGGGEAAIENHRHRLPHNLHETYSVAVAAPFRGYYHHLPGCLLHNDPEGHLHQLYHHLPLIMIPILPFLSPFVGPSHPLP